MIVIPMAGLSRRFHDQGYKVPKYMLDLHGRTVFSHAIGSFAGLFETEPFLFIAREEAGAAAFISRELDILGVRRFSTVILPAATRGQADTVMQGLEREGVANCEPITIFNIDTFRPGFQIPDEPWAPAADGWLEVMIGDDPGFSYVLPDPESQDQRVLETAEKRVISQLASTGVYNFRRAGHFVDSFQCESERGGGAELYVAPLYNHLIAKGLSIHYRLVSAESVMFCGVPQQYEDLQRRTSPGSPHLEFGQATTQVETS